MAIRVTQSVLEALTLSDNASIRVTQCVLEVLVSPFSTCETAWTLPAPSAYPTVALSGPRPLYFDELEPDWGNYGKLFPDMTPNFSTLQSAKVRRFIFRYDGLSEAEAAILDDHYESTRGGLSFAFTQPRTSEALTGVRYEGRPESNHTKVWSQSRVVRLVKYP